ncbi:glycosyltransferase family 2 protein [Nocardia cyriacigeorgica]|uniref:Glycosyltransferase family 2 protein n=1 Tax=Nocardia cyriacigeorgica TaxID=135487 RepID=A0A6P1CVQ9_9NOCA|nr:MULTISPECIES: glycosyltransferase family 2 protein [Nocardia]NEW36611.1 glycosyltransferase family 2 protein [Nocardia cyriacigeorgica]
MPHRVVIIPAHHEPETVGAVAAAVPDCLEADVLVLDDGGNGVLGELPPRVQVLEVPGQGSTGNGAVVRFGLAAALDRGAQEIYRLDGDGQHDPRYLPAAAEALHHGADVVIGSRFHPSSPAPAPGPVDRLLLTESMRHLVHQLTGLQLTDVISGFWALRAELAGELLPHLTTTGYGLTLELLCRAAHAGAAIAEIPHPQIYAGTARMTTKYASDQLTARCARAGTYLAVLSTVAADLGLTLGAAS